MLSVDQTRGIDILKDTHGRGADLQLPLRRHLSLTEWGLGMGII